MSSACASSAVTMAARLWRRLPCVMMTPLGSAVEPEVYCRKAGVAASAAGGSARSAAPPPPLASRSLLLSQRRSGHATAAAAEELRAKPSERTRRAPSASAASDMARRYSACESATAAPLSRAICAKALT